MAVGSSTMPWGRTEFYLDESGDVCWKLSEDAEPQPFFTSETFEVYPGSAEEPAILKFYGNFAGHIIEFRVKVDNYYMFLTYEKCCTLKCQKLPLNNWKHDVPFNFLGAFEEGYFSDVVIKADSGKEFKCHVTILNLSAPELNWLHTPPPLTGLHEDVLQATLHYLYTECLPRGVSEDTARACIKTVGKLPGFKKFTELCETFLKNTALKQQIISLVTDMHACADKIIELFNSKGTGCPDGQSSTEEALMCNPAKLCYTVKQVLREGAVACAKLLILCDLFSRRKGELSREERHEIIRYAKSRLPMFMNQLHKFLEVCKQHLCSLSESQCQEIATYLVPEIETTLETISQLAIETKAALEQVINSSEKAEKPTEKVEKHKKVYVGDMLGKTLRNALHLRELKKLKSCHERTTTSFVHLLQKRESFSLMTEAEKIRSIAKNLGQLIDEVPLFLIRIEELISALDEKVSWREWKYLFKLGTSKVSWALGKALVNKPTLKSILGQVCDIVHRDQFTTSLVTLGLFSPDTAGTDAANNMSCKAVPPTKYAQLSSVESLCQSPIAQESTVACRALELLKKGHNTDMSFEILQMHEGGDLVIDHTQGEPVKVAESGQEVDVCQIRAHRVVIAARCDWFRRALLSGMRESIDKKITVHDTSPDLFRLFLEYLYSGHLESSELSTEQLSDLITLADRYEVDCLKSVCEHALKNHIDDETALYLLTLADQLSAKSLREAALCYVVEHPLVKKNEVFEDLPEHLQTTVEDAVAWRGVEPRNGHSYTATPLDEWMNNVDLTDRRDLPSSDSLENMQFVEDSAQMESCIEDLRNILGDDVSREQLIQLALAADCNSNRALNYFYT